MVLVQVLYAVVSLWKLRKAAFRLHGSRSVGGGCIHRSCLLGADCQSSGISPFVPASMSTRHMGHLLLVISHWSTHSTWKRCMHGRRLYGENKRICNIGPPDIYKYTILIISLSIMMKYNETCRKKGFSIIPRRRSEFGVISDQLCRNIQFLFFQQHVGKRTWDPSIQGHGQIKKIF